MGMVELEAHAVLLPVLSRGAQDAPGKLSLSFSPFGVWQSRGLARRRGGKERRGNDADNRAIRTTRLGLDVLSFTAQARR